MAMAFPSLNELKNTHWSDRELFFSFPLNTTSRILYGLGAFLNFDLENWVKNDYGKHDDYGKLSFDEEGAAEFMINIVMNQFDFYELIIYLIMTFGMDIQAIHELAIT